MELDLLIQERRSTLHGQVCVESSPMLIELVDW